MKKRYFTLVELLVVVGIVVILAGLVLPAVIGGAQQGRITQAKSDMKSIQMALAQMDQTYGRILKQTGSDYLFSTGEDDSNKGAPLTISDGSVTISGESDYNSLIAELTVNGRYTSGNLYYRHNPRKVRFLDPKGNFDTTQDFDQGENKDNLWRDPWGNRYVIIINVDGSEQIVRPDDNNKRIMGKTAVYSYGPNGENDNGKNAVEGGSKLEDDIATWHK